MKKKKVPQDVAESYNGIKKVFFAVDDEGNYKRVTSVGWEAEETVTSQALEEFRRLAAEAAEQFRKNQTSPLAYHMYNARMDIQLLSHATGIPKFRIRRHMRIHVFNRLKDRVLLRYCDALGITPDIIRTIPSLDTGDINLR